MIKRGSAVLVAAGFLAACATAAPPAPTGSADGSGAHITVNGSSALQWGQGRYGVVLAHGAAFDAASWQKQAVRIAAQDATVVAVEDISPAGIVAAVEYLHRDRGIADVALVGGSAGADAILEVASSMPELPDQLVLLSPNAEQGGLGVEPKLFVAGAGEPLVDVARRLAATAAGTENDALIVAGSAHAQNIFATDQGESVTRALLERLARADP